MEQISLDQRHRNMNSENPYSTPAGTTGNGLGPMPGGVGLGFIRQIVPICICMIIQGALELLMGLLYIIMAFVMPSIMAQQSGPQMPQEGQEMANIILWVVYGGGGGIALIAGLLRIVSGIRGLYFRGYKMGIVSHFFGLLNLLTCYCVPTSLGLCVWGCIVFFNPQVKQAFKLGQLGHSPREIEAQFSQY